MDSAEYSFRFHGSTFKWDPKLVCGIEFIKWIEWIKARVLKRKVINEYRYYLQFISADFNKNIDMKKKQNIFTEFALICPSWLDVCSAKNKSTEILSNIMV